MRRIAMDGLATGEIDPPAWADLFPGYREDVLVHFKKAGIYFLVDRGIRQGQQASPVQPLFKGGDTTKILAVIKVVDSSENLPKAYLGTRSWTAPAKRSFPADNAFRKYQPHKSLLTAGQQSFEVHKKCKDMKTYDGCQNVRLGINFQPPSTLNFTVGGNGDRSQDIYQPYQNVGKPGGPTDAPFNPKQRRILRLGHTDQWTITAGGGGVATLANGHPFHIHINPFELVSLIPCTPAEMLDPRNKAKCQDQDLMTKTGTRQTYWKDTLFVPVGWTATVLSKYTVYSGDFVYHCHILDHEDEGMMEVVRICGQDNRGEAGCQVSE